MAKADFSDVIIALEEGRRLYKHHRKLWLWEQISNVVYDVSDRLKAIYEIDSLDLWLSEEGDSLMFVVGSNKPDDMSHGAESVIASVRVPLGGDNDDLVDHGVLTSFDKHLVVKFSDADSFRRALCSLLRMGAVGKAFERVLQIGLDLKKPCLPG